MTTQELINIGVQTGQYPRYIYKYMPCKDYVLSSLKNHYLWFSHFSEFNDPYEGNVRISTSYTTDELTAFVIARQSEWGDCNVRKFLANPKEMINKLIFDTQKELKVCCFSSTNDNLLMWSHYASDHKGICLQFDITKESSELFHFLRPIRYTNVNEICNYIKNPEGYINRLIYTKSLDWAYEKEYRISFPCPTNHQISYSSEALISVIFGCRIDPIFQKQVISSLPTTMCYKKCELNKYEFKIDIKDL